MNITRMSQEVVEIARADSPIDIDTQIVTASPNQWQGAFMPPGQQDNYHAPPTPPRIADQLYRPGKFCLRQDSPDHRVNR
ncbi:unnamed protein product [Rotaria magnacalcarata]|nr:unnamed protein product [Rotaria magnacalcarata]